MGIVAPSSGFEKGCVTPGGDRSPAEPDPKSWRHEPRASVGPNAFSMRRRTDLLILPHRSVEERRTSISGQRFGKVFAGSSCLEWIAKPFIFCQRTFEGEPRTSLVALPELQEPDGAVHRGSQHGDRMAGAVGFGMECP